MTLTKAQIWLHGVGVYSPDDIKDGALGSKAGRNRKLLACALGGESMASIGRKFSISGTQVKTVIVSYARRHSRTASAGSDVPLRVANAMFRAGFSIFDMNDESDVMKACSDFFKWADEKYRHPIKGEDGSRNFDHIQNFGKKSMSDLQSLLGQEEIADAKVTRKVLGLTVPLSIYVRIRRIAEKHQITEAD